MWLRIETLLLQKRPEDVHIALNLILWPFHLITKSMRFHNDFDFVNTKISNNVSGPFLKLKVVSFWMPCSTASCWMSLRITWKTFSMQLISGPRAGILKRIHPISVRALRTEVAYSYLVKYVFPRDCYYSVFCMPSSVLGLIILQYCFAFRRPAYGLHITTLFP